MFLPVFSYCKVFYMKTPKRKSDIKFFKNRITKWICNLLSRNRIYYLEFETY